MKKEIITVQVDYEIAYELGHRESAIEDALRLVHRVTGGWYRVTKLLNTAKLVDVPIAEPRHCEFFDDLDRTALKDCQGDGHYECRKCERLDPESLMIVGQEDCERR